MEVKKIFDEYGCNTFTDSEMKARIPNSTYRDFHDSLDKGEELSRETATVIANAMKLWAIERGATHFTHWFSPMTGLTAEKHDAFLEPKGDSIALEFSGKTLRKGEPDASSFPSGGLRATFEARGYTSWDCTSPAFVKDGSLYIPTLFSSYTGEALDKKTPLLRSVDAINKAALNVLPKIGVEGVGKVTASCGAEQEYFLVLDEFFQKRMDLKLTGRTLFGAPAPKGQELEDHYFGSLKRKVAAFMKELDEVLWSYGIPSKTKHNEVAPAQHEVACVYSKVNVTSDNNLLLMILLQDIAKKHGLRCLLHEKPFAGVNGSGKHNNWSVVTDTGINLFNPGEDPIHNKPFLMTLACTVKGVDEYADLLRMTAATAGNDHRLGANEAPPAIISIFLGEDLDRVVEEVISGKKIEASDKVRFKPTVGVIPSFSKDNTDRNRTSPFAFTGNKFEFRAVGSSQSVAGPNAVLNAVLATEFNEFAALLDQGMDFYDICKKFFKEHQRIIFNGDGYSKEWQEEASRRGLHNHKNTVEALECLREEANITMLEEVGVYSRTELLSRYEILMDNYEKIIRVEAATALKMARTEIYPAACEYLGKLSQELTATKAVGIKAEFLEKDVHDLSKLIDKLARQMDSLKEKMSIAEQSTAETHKKALYWREEVFTAMEELRIYADAIEEVVDEKYWPIPNYMDLLFGI